MLKEARRASEAEGVALNRFINVAVAEKLSARRSEGYFPERGRRGDIGRQAPLETRRPGKTSSPEPA